MRISEIYEKYKIMPQLQLHQLRVAGVALLICNNLEKSLDKGSIMSACLLHDMGNIIKFKLDLFPENLKPQGINYWKSVKKEYLNKYGEGDHMATHKICKELGVSSEVLRIIKSFGFSQVLRINESKKYNFKVDVYSDMRVAPNGITSLGKRLSEAKKRYAGKIKAKYTYKEFDNYASIWKINEKQIFTHCKIKPEDITEEKVKLLFDLLRNFEIKKNI